MGGTTPLGFGERLEQAITDSGLSRQEIALRSGIPRTTFDRLMLRADQWNIWQVEAFAAATGAEAGWIYTGQRTADPAPGGPAGADTVPAGAATRARRKAAA